MKEELSQSSNSDFIKICKPLPSYPTTAAANKIVLDRGVRQGTVVGQLLSILTQQETTALKTCELVKFADDTMSPTSSKEKSNTDLEQNIHLLSKYFLSLKLQIKDSKTAFIVFG